MPLGIFIFATWGLAQNPKSQTEIVQTVNYCSVVKNPDLYNEKRIRVHGIYNSGFEVSAFYNQACFDASYSARRQTWVDNFYRNPVYSEMETAEIVNTFRGGKAGAELEVTLTGIFRGSKEHGGFGHLGGYSFEIDVLSIEEANLLPNQIFGCQRIDRTKPFHFIAYEKMEVGHAPRYDDAKQPKREKLIYLRLANNSTCSIKLPTINIENGLELKDGSEIPIIYTLSSPCRRVHDRPTTARDQALAVLAPGNSIYFAVPLRNLTKDPFEVRVPFYFQTQKADAHYQPFYFSRYELPESLRADLDCTRY